MFVLGLAGQAGVGKDTVADYLVKAYGFKKFAFTDALYAEAQAAYSLPDQSLLRDRDTKEVPTERLALVNCQSDEFIGVAVQHIAHESRHLHDLPLSPRQVLQLWGTEYRRAQDSNYWLNRAEDFIYKIRAEHLYPEHAPQYFVEVGTRFENEREWIHSGGCCDGWAQGNVWHIRREGSAPVAAHVSETELPVLPRERELWNNDSIARFHRGVDLLMSTHARFVRVEPMAPYDPVYVETA
jgi:hypothetical protein